MALRGPPPTCPPRSAGRTQHGRPQWVGRGRGQNTVHIERVHRGGVKPLHTDRPPSSSAALGAGPPHWRGGWGKGREEGYERVGTGGSVWRKILAQTCHIMRLAGANAIPPCHGSSGAHHSLLSADTTPPARKRAAKNARRYYMVGAGWRVKWARGGT